MFRSSTGEPISVLPGTHTSFPASRPRIVATAIGTLHILLTVSDTNGDTANTVFDLNFQGPPVPLPATVTTQVVTLTKPATATDTKPVPIVTIITDDASPPEPATLASAHSLRRMVGPAHATPRRNAARRRSPPCYPNDIQMAPLLE